MRLTFLGRASEGGESPTLYATDQDTYLVQGYIVTDGEVLAGLEIPAGETVVEIYPRLLDFLSSDGINDSTAVFTVFDGAGAAVERQLTTDPATVELCRSAFESVWSAAVPHGEYTAR